MIKVTTGSGASFTGANYQEVLWKLYRSFNNIELDDIDYAIRDDQRGQRLFPITFNYWQYMNTIADRAQRAMRVSITTTQVDLFFDDLLRMGVFSEISNTTSPSRSWPIEEIFGPSRPVRVLPENLPADPNALRLPFQIVTEAELLGGFQSNVIEPDWSHPEPNFAPQPQPSTPDTAVVQPGVPEPVTPPIDVAVNSNVIGVADIPPESPLQVKTIVETELTSEQLEEVVDKAEAGAQTAPRIASSKSSKAR